MSNLSSANVGDLIAVDGGWTRTSTVNRIDRTTKTLVISGLQKFRRDSGLLLGSAGYSRIRARLATEQDLINHRIETARQGLSRFKVTEESLEAIELLLGKS